MNYNDKTNTIVIPIRYITNTALNIEDQYIYLISVFRYFDMSGRSNTPDCQKTSYILSQLQFGLKDMSKFSRVYKKYILYIYNYSNI